MNLNLNMMNRVRNPNRMPFDVFSKSLQDKLIELGYKKKKVHILLVVPLFTCFITTKRNTLYLTIMNIFVLILGYIHFINSIENNPFEYCNRFCSPSDFTKENLDKLFEKATNYAANSKKCMIQAKLDEIEKDF